MRRDVKLSRDVTTMEIATSHNNLIDDWFNQRGIVVLHVRHASEYISLSVSFKQQREKRLIGSLRNDEYHGGDNTTKR